MKKLHLSTASVIGVALLLACSSSKPDGLGDNNPSQAQGSTGSGTSTGTSTSNGGNGNGNGSGLTGIPIGPTAGNNSGTNNGGAANGSNVGTGSTSTGSTRATGAGSTPSGTGSTPNSTVGGAGNTGIETTDGGAGTLDPPKATGGTGETLDPPVGDTGDPPVGDTGDPPVGDTGDPPVGDTGDPPVGDTGDPPVGDTPDPPAGCTMTEIDKINVIVFKNATPSGADVEGKMWVGGNATFSGYAIASKDPAAAATKCTEYSLVVGGNLSGSINSGSGNVAYGGSSNAAVSPCMIFHDTPVDFAAVEKKLKGYSAALNAYPPNGTVSTAGGGLTLTGTDKTLNIFSLTAAQLTSTGTVKFAVPASSSVIVNVSGTAVNWSGVGFVLPDGQSCRGGTSDYCHKIMFNFFEAKTIQLSGIGVQGSVLAPYAAVSGDGGNVDGQLVCDSLTGSIEYHPYFFSGCLLLPKKP